MVRGPVGLLCQAQLMEYSPFPKEGFPAVEVRLPQTQRAYEEGEGGVSGPIVQRRIFSVQQAFLATEGITYTHTYTAAVHRWGH